MLRKKNKRIEDRKDAIEIYNKYLEDVKVANDREFQEIPDILKRHETLLKVGAQLERKGKELHTSVEI